MKKYLTTSALIGPGLEVLTPFLGGFSLSAYCLLNAAHPTLQGEWHHPWHHKQSKQAEKQDHLPPTTWCASSGWFWLWGWSWICRILQDCYQLSSLLFGKRAPKADTQRWLIRARFPPFTARHATGSVCLQATQEPSFGFLCMFPYLLKISRTSGLKLSPDMTRSNCDLYCMTQWTDACMK